MIFRAYIQKKDEYQEEAAKVLIELRENWGIKNLKDLDIFLRYDVEGIDEDLWQVIINNVLSDPVTDRVYLEDLPLNTSSKILVVEYMPGQFDQRADSTEQLIRVLSPNTKPVVECGKAYSFKGHLSIEDSKKIKQYLINPVDSREGTLEKAKTLTIEDGIISKVPKIDGFRSLSSNEIANFINEMGLAMTQADLIEVIKYFKDEDRDPTETEIRVLDTYWSDHCRHTTFNTKLNYISFSQDTYSGMVKDAFEEYLTMRKTLQFNGDKDISLMDIATIAAKYLKNEDKISNLDISEEINACSVRVSCLIGNKEEEWIVFFKNETHNHPTEVEPFGGAATCLGGAIRDPLSGRGYVYQAMRVTGSGDPRTTLKDTLPGKLPQKTITQEAARGYSSYGNQIGLATGLVSEIYHPGYVAKRMEVGAVVGAAPLDHIVRKRPVSGDRVILVGGRTGRDGIGGATGSSKEQNTESVRECGAQVQKGNPPTERNLQRLFRRKEASILIKRCNDFGAGGVSVAVGELADSIDVNLDMIRKKYEGLNGTELAISESQERMAVVLDKNNVKEFISFAQEENLEAYEIAEITNSGYFNMFWQGERILSIKRSFLETNGATQEAALAVKEEVDIKNIGKSLLADSDNENLPIKQRIELYLQDLNCCSQKGLVERFDSTIGSRTLLMPFGGKTQLTPGIGMAASLPVSGGNTDTTTLMTYGFDPFLSSVSPFHGALYSVVDSFTKIIAMGGKQGHIWLSFQEYFEKLTDAESWAKPFSALLGALKAQKELEVGAIGGKDSMSGSYEDLKVPPTLISFALGITEKNRILSPEIKNTSSQLILLKIKWDEKLMPDFTSFKRNMSLLEKLAEEGVILAAQPLARGGIFIATLKMALGNMIGVTINNITKKELFEASYGSVVLEIPEDIDVKKVFNNTNYHILGSTNNQMNWKYYEKTDNNLKDLAKPVYKSSLKILQNKWVNPLEEIFPTLDDSQEQEAEKISAISYAKSKIFKSTSSFIKPRVLIPVFPGTNCEEDSAYAFEKAGGVPAIEIFRNLSENDLKDSLKSLAARIRESQILMIPGGFSGGDEPDGSGKFIATVFRSPEVSEALEDFLVKREGLVLGICNGFQGLVKLGLLPFGEIRERNEMDPILTTNKIGRHQSKLVHTRVSSVNSPWMEGLEVGEIYTLPVSHGEGQFLVDDMMLEKLISNGQIATQYVDLSGQATMELPWNPNGSTMAIEGLFSPNGRIFGKMCHSERFKEGLYKNVDGNFDQRIFQAGIKYYR